MGDSDHRRDNQLALAMDPSEALVQIMDLYGDRILRTAYFYLGDRQLAEDVTQETLLRAYRSWAQFRGGSVKTWLMVIAANLCRDRMRSRSCAEEATDPQNFPHWPTSSLEDEVFKRLQTTTVLKAVLALPQPFQEVLYLYYYMDLNTGEIAEVLSCAEGTVRSRLHRARADLKERLTEEGLTR